jgi:hypothetical protein
MIKEFLGIIFGLLIILTNPDAVESSEILNQHSGVIFGDISLDTTNDAPHRMLPVQIINGENAQISDFATIDLDQFAFPERSSMLQIYVTDWVRDRVLFADMRQVRVPDYFILDLRSRAIYRPQSNILNQVFGDMVMSPNCNYIIYFGEDYELADRESLNYLQDHNLLFTVCINAETFNIISRLNAFTASVGSGIPAYYFSGDSILYINNPFAGPADQQLVKLELPSLSIRDTIKINSICGNLCPEVAVWDVKAGFSLIYTTDSRDSLLPAYLVINLKSRSIVGRLEVPRYPIFGAARLSDDANFVAFQEGHRYIIYDRLFRRQFEITGVPDYSLPGARFERGNIVFYSEKDKAILEYELATGKFLRLK